MREKTKKRYSLWDNCRYTFYHLKQKMGAEAFAICGADIAASIVLPFLEASLAGAAAACLVSGKALEVILLLAAGYVLLLQMVRFWQSHIRGVRQKTLFAFRWHMTEDFYQKILEMDGQSLESAEGQRKWKEGLPNLYSGNDKGIEAYAASYLELIFNLGGLAVYGAVVGRRSLPLLLLLILQALLSAVFHAMAGKHSYKMEEESGKHWKTFFFLRHETIVPGNGKDIRLYQMDHWFLRLFREQIEQLVALIDRGQTGIMAAGIAEKLLSFVRNLLVYGYLIMEMAKGEMTLPAFLLYVGIAAGFEAWMSGLFEAVQKIGQNEKLMDAYREFMDFGIVEEKGKKAPLYAGKAHEIRLENVCFRYGGNDTDTIHNLSLTIKAGEKLALVGLNGAGKTTLVKLICGLYRPAAGRIYLDGQDLGTLSVKEIFKEFSIVFQDVFSFSFPLAENVSCKKEGQEEEGRLQESLEKAGLWERVLELPKGARTVMNKDLDEEGVTLSGGELQKLMLSRALYKNAPVVILDEPTAALDPIAESELYEKYDEMIQQKTGIFISHRLSSTRFCDRILFMEKGQVIEEGSHGELMEKKGAYADLFALQARYYQKKKQEEESYA